MLIKERLILVSGRHLLPLKSQSLGRCISPRLIREQNMLLQHPLPNGLLPILLERVCYALLRRASKASKALISQPIQLKMTH